MKEDILKSYDIVSKNYGYNSNSLHKLGLDARKIEEAASKQILDVLGLTNYEVIYTSGNAESLTAIKSNVDDRYEMKYIDLKLGNKYEDLNKYDFIIIEDDIPFFGVLLKRKNINFKPLINGGKSTTEYRSGTSVTPLIVSFSKLVKLKYKK